MVSSRTLIPALVELALELVDPFLGRVQRRMGGAGREIDEERLVGRDGFLAVDPGDGVVGDVFGQVIALFRLFRRLDRRLVAEELRLPLAGLAAVESVPIFKALAGRPTRERPDRRGLPVGRIVPFAPGRRAVAVFLQHLGHRRGFERPDAVIARKTGREFGDGAEADLMMVEAGQHRRAGRRADAGGVERVVAKAFARKLVEVGRRDRSAECAGMAEADIVEQDDDDIGRAFGGLEGLRKIGDRVLVGLADLALEGGRRPGQGVVRLSGGRRRSSRREPDK